MVLRIYILVLSVILPYICVAQETETVKVHHTEKMGKELSAEERKKLMFLTKVEGVSRVTGYDFTNVRDTREFKRAFRKGTGVNKFVQEMYPDLRVKISAKDPANPNDKFIHERKNPEFWTCNMTVTVTVVESDESTDHDKTYGLVAGIMHDFNAVEIVAENDNFDEETWTSNPGSIYYGGISFPLGEKFQTLLAGMYKGDMRISTHSEELKMDLYGGKVTVGSYQSGFNPNVGIFYMQGVNDYGNVALPGGTIGVDLMRTDWKIGIEAGYYWFNTDMNIEGYEPGNTELLALNGEKRVIYGVNLKLYF